MNEDKKSIMMPQTIVKPVQLQEESLKPFSEHQSTSMKPIMNPIEPFKIGSDAFGSTENKNTQQKKHLSKLFEDSDEDEDTIMDRQKQLSSKYTSQKPSLQPPANIPKTQVRPPTKPISSLFNDDDESPLNQIQNSSEIKAVPLIAKQVPNKEIPIFKKQESERELQAPQELESKRNLAYNLAKKNKRDQSDDEDDEEEDRNEWTKSTTKLAETSKDLQINQESKKMADDKRNIAFNLGTKNKRDQSDDEDDENYENNDKIESKKLATPYRSIENAIPVSNVTKFYSYLIMIIEYQNCIT